MRARGSTGAIVSSRPFNAVMVRVLEEVHNASEESSGGVTVGRTLVMSSEWSISTTSSRCLTYVDDLCLMVSAEKPNELIERTAEMIGCVDVLWRSTAC